MDRQRIEQRIAGLEARGLLTAADRRRIDRALETGDWAGLELFLNQLEVEARFRSWRPIIRLAMFSSAISALILLGVVVWVAVKQPAALERVMMQPEGKVEANHEHGRQSAGD